MGRIFAPVCSSSSNLRPIADQKASIPLPSSSTSSSLTLSRRTALGALVASPQLISSAPAHAIRQLPGPSGTTVDAYEFDIDLKIAALKGSVPQAWINDFRQVVGRSAKVYLEQKGQYSEIMEALRKENLPEPDDDLRYRMSRPIAHCDLVSLGDQWLGGAIRDGLVQPIPNAEQSRWWKALDHRWHDLVRRDPRTGLIDPRGPVFAAPYRWGCTLIVYNKKRLLKAGGRPIEDWADLLQPQLRGKLGFMDSTREFGGVVMRTLGLSYNATPDDVRRAGLSPSDLARRCADLRRQLLLVSDRDHVRAFQCNDALCIVGNSSDLYPVSQRMSEAQLVAPRSGTALWADMWAVPTKATGGNRKQGPSPLTPVWIEYSLAPQRSRIGLGISQGGAAPAMLPPPAPRGGPAWSEADASVVTGVMPSAASLSRSEFIAPLDGAGLDMYRNMLVGPVPVGTKA